MRTVLGFCVCGSPRQLVVEGFEEAWATLCNIYGLGCLWLGFLCWYGSKAPGGVCLSEALGCEVGFATGGDVYECAPEQGMGGLIFGLDRLTFSFVE